MYKVNNDHLNITEPIERSITSDKDKDKDKKNSFLNLFDIFFSVSFSYKGLLTSTSTDDGKRNHNEFFCFVRKICSHEKYLLLEENDEALADMKAQGHELMKARDAVMLERTYKVRPQYNRSLMPKTAIIAGLILAGGVNASSIMGSRRLNDLRAPSSDYTTPDYYIYGSGHINEEEGIVYVKKTYDEKEIASIRERFSFTIYEYEMDMHIIEGLVVPEFLDASALGTGRLGKKINKRTINEYRNRNVFIPNLILEIIRDHNIDWRVRNEFDLIFRRADTSVDVRRLKSQKKRNIMLLAKCIQFTKVFLDENRKRRMSNTSYGYAEVIMNRLFCIAGALNAKNRMSIFKLLKDNKVIADESVITQHECMSKKHKHKHKHKQKFENSGLNSADKRNDNAVVVGEVNINNRGYLHNHNLLYYVEASDRAREKKNNDGIIDDVKKVSLIECRDEREKLYFSDILRIVGRSLKNPIAEVFKEGMIIYQYNYLEEGCKNNDELYDKTKKVEGVMSYLLSLIPDINNLQTGLQIASGVLELMADDIDGKELSVDNIASVNDGLISLFKGVVSGLASEQMSKMKERPDSIKAMIEKIRYNHGGMTIQMEVPNKQIEIKEIYNHFANAENENFLFYNENDNWVVNNNIDFTHTVKKTLEKANKFFLGEKDLMFIQNSSPKFYQDAIIVNDGKQLYILVGNEFRTVREVKFNNDDYRYLMTENVYSQPHDSLVPAIYKGGKWYAEDKTSRAVSNELLECVSRYDKISNKLVSKNIKHRHISPLTLSRDIQFDKWNNKYIKINDEYFLLKMDNAGSVYIEGKRHKFSLAKMSGRYYPKTYERERLLAISKTELTKPSMLQTNKKIFLDGSVEMELRKKFIRNGNQQRRRIYLSKESEMLHSKIIEGAVHFENEDYFLYSDCLINVRSNGDDTYTLRFTKDTENEIMVYKNAKSNTYYFLTDENRSINRKRKSHCVSKRQILSVCSTSYHETPNLNLLLKKNKDHAVKIDDPANRLVPSSLVVGTYRNEKNDLFYHFQGDEYFHCVEEPDEQPFVIPAFITIHGKKENEEIDPSVIISSVSVIKDFDTHEIIMSTPSEAQEIVFNIDAETSRLLLEWQDANFRGDDIDHNDFVELPTILASYEEISDVKDMILYGGKKKIKSLHMVNRRIDQYMSRLGEGYDDIRLLSLDPASREFLPRRIATIYVAAATDALSILRGAASKITSHKESVINYIINELDIRDERVHGLLIEAFKIKFDRIGLILNENDMGNLKILVGNDLEPRSNKVDIPLNNDVTLGVTPCDDPLDRMIFNALFIPHDIDISMNAEQINQQQEYFTNIATETMLHEAVHATGPTEDYLYLDVNDIGRLESIRDALTHTERSIGSDMMREGFIYLSKIYFSINPVYHKYNIDNLIIPQNLREIYSADNYFKALLLLNNPDAFAILIRDISELE